MPKTLAVSLGFKTQSRPCIRDVTSAQLRCLAVGRTLSSSGLDDLDPELPCDKLVLRS